MLRGYEISVGRFQRAFRNESLRQMRRLRFYNREVSASAVLEQEEGEATSGENLPPVLET
jgi:hypothetical protein